MMTWLKGWRGMAVGAAFIALSLVYNSAFKTQIADSIILQILGYFLIGIGCAIVMYAAVASPDAKKEEASEEAPAEDTAEAPTEEEE